MPLFAACAQRKKDRGREESAVQNHQRLVRNLGKELLGIDKLVGVVGPKSSRRQKVRAQRHQRHHAHKRIAAGTAVGVRAAEVVAVVLTVGHAQRGAVDAIDTKAQKAVRLGALMSPASSGRLEEPQQRQNAQPLPGLVNGAGSNGRPLWKREAELVDDLNDGQMPEKRHADNEPNDLLGRELSPADRGRAGGRQGLQDGL